MLWPHQPHIPNIPRTFAPRNMKLPAKYLASGNVGYLDEGGVVTGDPGSDDPESINNFNEDVQGSQIPPMVASAPPPGYVVPTDEAGNPVNAEDYSSRPVEAQAYLDESNGPMAAPASNPLTDIPVPLPAPFANRIPGKDTTLQGAYETERQIAAQQPVRNAPKWWERGLAGTVGGLAGWANAASRMKQPINAGPAEENILYPGYTTKLAEWQSRLAPAEAQTQIMGQQLGAQYGARKVQSEAQLKAAQAQAAMSHGEYWLSRSEQERNQWKIDPKTGELYNTISGQTAQKPPTPQDRYWTAIALHATPEQATYFALNEKMPEPKPVVPPRPVVVPAGATAIDPTSGKTILTAPKTFAPARTPADRTPAPGRPSPQSTFVGIERSKDAAFAKAKAKLEATRGANPNADDVYNQEMKAAQANYEQQIRDAGGSVPAPQTNAGPSPASSPATPSTQLTSGAQARLTPAPATAEAPAQPVRVTPPPASAARAPLPGFPANLATRMQVGVPRPLKLADGTTITVVKQPDGNVYQQ